MDDAHSLPVDIVTRGARRNYSCKAALFKCETTYLLDHIEQSLVCVGNTIEKILRVNSLHLEQLPHSCAASEFDKPLPYIASDPCSRWCQAACVLLEKVDDKDVRVAMHLLERNHFALNCHHTRAAR